MSKYKCDYCGKETDDFNYLRFTIYDDSIGLFDY